MTHASASAFPELRRVFSGYLHEDFAAVSGTPDAALRAFWADAAPEERRRFQREARKLLAHAATLTLEEMRAFLHRLGCRWIPPSHDALVSLLTDRARLHEPRDR